MSCQHGNWPPCDLCNEIDAAYLNGHKHATEVAQAELTELRAIVARLREPVSDAALSDARKAYAASLSPRHSDALKDALDAYRKFILGETE